MPRSLTVNQGLCPQRTSWSQPAARARAAAGTEGASEEGRCLWQDAETGGKPGPEDQQEREAGRPTLWRWALSRVPLADSKEASRLSCAERSPPPRRPGAQAGVEAQQDWRDARKDRLQAATPGQGRGSGPAQTEPAAGGGPGPGRRHTTCRPGSRGRWQPSDNTERTRADDRKAHHLVGWPICLELKLHLLD